LQKRLDVIKVVDQLPSDLNKIYFGAWVSLVDEQDVERKVRIVGPDEIDPKLGYISIDAPLAKALVGKELDDLVELADLNKSYEIMQIDYEP